ncbi:microsomal glutathione S-transferase 2-like [Gigantopelta aegis]|uniref:microsomal glutathione S-transferase 2-like n=1 Tax=Gigantopelta aegis TaxID=1735272 RepID=UPI001B889A53|nr:microsomal glutathione S-transferase 2-like [Gigantopelta aegis]
MSDRMMHPDFLQLQDIVFPATVTLISGLQLVQMARRVGKLRLKLKIEYPTMTGDPLFERVLRAQQNSFEFHPIFLSSLWMSSLFFHQVPSSLMGIVYIYSRQKYIEGYSKDAESRLPGFKLGMKSMMVMLAMSVAGIVTVTTRMYTGVDLAEKASGFIQRALPWQ